MGGGGGGGGEEGGGGMGGFTDKLTSTFHHYAPVEQTLSFMSARQVFTIVQSS